MWMVVGFEVMPCSIKRVKGEPLEDIPCKPWGDADNPEPQVCQHTCYCFQSRMRPDRVSRCACRRIQHGCHGKPCFRALCTDMSP